MLSPFCRWLFIPISLLFQVPKLFLSQRIGFSLCRLPEIPLCCLPSKGFEWQSQRLPFQALLSHEESHSSFCSPFSTAEFLARAFNFSSSTATGPDEVAYSMLKQRLPSGMDFLHIFNLSWSLHSIWKTSSIIPINKMGKPLDSPASSLSLSPSASQSFLNTSSYPVYSFFWNLIPFSLPARPVSFLDSLL